MNRAIETINRVPIERDIVRLKSLFAHPISLEQVFRGESTEVSKLPSSNAHALLNSEPALNGVDADTEADADTDSIRNIVFVKNLCFNTTKEMLLAHARKNGFKPRAATIATKKAAKSTKSGFETSERTEVD